MPTYVGRRAQNILNDAGLAINGARILLLGVTYKADIADQRESPAVPLARVLMGLGAKITYHDPNIESWRVAGTEVQRADDLLGALSEADLVILVQNHSAYDAEKLSQVAKRFFDTRGATSGRTSHRL